MSSTDKALYKFIDEVLCALNDKIHVVRILIFCDLAMAFDWTNLDILLTQLNTCKIQGKAGQWL